MRHRINTKIHQYLDQLVFDGLCTHGDNNKDVIKMLDTDHVDVCNDVCLETPNCTAFAYTDKSIPLYASTPKVAKSCYLYGGGPYIYGNGLLKSKCYVLNKGMCEFSAYSFILTR